MAEKHAIDTAELLNKYKKAMLNTGIIVLGLLVALRIYGYQQKKISELKNQNKTESEKNQVLQDIGQVEEKLNSYKSFLNQKDISSVIRTLGNVAKDSSIKIVSLKPGQEKKYPEYTAHPFTLTIEAENYHLLSKFISNLENHPDVYIVQSANLKPLRQASEQEAANLVMELQLYTILYND